MTISPGRWKSFPAFWAWQRLLAIYNRFRFTTLVYTLIVVHCGIPFIGGHYTYADVPLFNWIRDRFHLMRNDYDRVGHFAQGFVPYLIAREVTIRLCVFKSKRWRIFFCVGICLAISALYELFEMAGSNHWRIFGRRFSRHTGRPLGHSGRYGYGIRGCTNH